MSEIDPKQGHKGDDTSRVVLTVIGGALVLVGLMQIARQWFWPYLPFRELWNTMRGAGWGIGLVIVGIAAIIWTQRPGFKAPPKGTKIYRSRQTKMVSGVFGGLADYLSVDVTLLRIAFVGLALMFDVGPAIVAYIIAAIIVPEEPVGGAAGHVAADPASSPPPAPPIPPAPPVPAEAAPPAESPSE